MEAIPRKYGEWGQFDRYCKLVLYHEAIDYLREMKCRRDREVSLDAVSPADWDKLSTVDRYSCDSMTKCQEKNEMKKDGTTQAVF